MRLNHATYRATAKPLTTQHLPGLPIGTLEDTVTSFPNLQVPPRHRPVMRHLSRMPQGEYKELHTVLDDSDLGIRREAVQSRLRTHVGFLDEEAIDSLLDAVLMIRLTADTHDYEVGLVAQSVARSPELDLAESEIATLDNRLHAMLVAQGVPFIAKAYDVAHSHDKLLHSLRILTDLRPLFDEASERPRHALVNHVLRIEYWEDFEMRTSYIAMDTEAVKSMQQAVQRALDKASTLETMFSDADISLHDRKDV